MTINVVIADDHALFREALRSLLCLQSDISVTGEVDSAILLEDELERIACDILLLDLEMDRWTSSHIPALAQRTNVIVLTASESAEDGIAALRAGARGFVQKRFAFETLMTAIHTVQAGQVWMPPALQSAFVLNQLESAKSLSPRETEIVRCVAQGMRNGEIAERLSLSENTVKTYVTTIFDKLGVRDRVSLTHYALKHGLVNLKS
jgi:DNA-binding NarL/FixJ family response regulator